MKQYTETVKREISELFPEWDIKETTVVKRNDIKLHGIRVAANGSNVAPIFYLDNEYRMGVPPMEIAKTICSYVLMTDIKEPEAEDFSFDNIEDSLTLRLVDIPMNEEYLKERPYHDLGNGFGYVVSYDVSEEHGVVITNKIIEGEGLDFDRLYETALANENKNVTLVELNPVLFEKFMADEDMNYYTNGKMPEDIQMFILTNKTTPFGANAIFYPKVLDRVKLILGENFYILPISIGQALVIRESFLVEEDNLVEMLRDGNEKTCTPEEVLSDRVLHYTNYGVKVLGR